MGHLVRLVCAAAALASACTPGLIKGKQPGADAALGGDGRGGDDAAGDSVAPGDYQVVCNDGACAPGETCDTCPADCGTCDDVYVVEGEHYDLGSESEAVTAASTSGVTATLLGEASGQAAGRVTWSVIRATYTFRTRAGPHRLCVRLVSYAGDERAMLGVTDSDPIETADPAAAWEWICADYNVESPVSRISFSYYDGDALIDKVVLQAPGAPMPVGAGPAALPTCENRVCQVNETCPSCNDCCAAACDDGFCHGEESCATCPEDCGACGTVYTGVCYSAADVAALPPGHWCMVPDSAPRRVEKRPQEWGDWDGSGSASYDSYQRVIGFRGLVGAWGGGAFDSARDRLLLFGGGHNDYGGNELLAFDLDDLFWRRLGDPTAFPNRSPEYVNPDNTPTSRHTYGSMEYVVHVDRFFAHGGANDSAAGTCSAPGTWTFHLAQRETDGAYAPSHWELRAGADEPQSGCEDKSVYDPVTEKVYYATANNWLAYDIGTDAWSELNSDGGAYGTSVALTDRRTIVQLGNDVVDGYWRYDLGSPTLARTELSTTGAKAMESESNPGLAYDPIADAIVAWSGGASVFLLDLDTHAWTEQRPPATNLAAPGGISSSGGVYGRFRYSRRLNVYVMVESTDENVFLFRLAD
jgi:hypothetical protein